jgi:hypothetical protein
MLAKKWHVVRADDHMGLFIISKVTFIMTSLSMQMQGRSCLLAHPG